MNSFFVSLQIVLSLILRALARFGTLLASRAEPASVMLASMPLRVYRQHAQGNVGLFLYELCFLSWTGTPGTRGLTPGHFFQTQTLGSRAPSPGRITVTTTNRRTSRLACMVLSSSPLGATPTRTARPGASPLAQNSHCRVFRGSPS